MSISKKVLETIEEKHVELKPKWQFLLKDWVLWFVGGFSIIIGSVAVSVMILLVQDFDLDVARYSHRGSVVELFSAFPYLWGVILLVFVGIAYMQMKHTHTGYRYSPYVIVLLSVGLSIVIGTIFFFIGFGHSVDRVLSNKVPKYNMMIQQKAERWAYPERGLLAGIILRIEDRSLLLEDVKKEEWVVRLESSEGHVLPPFSVGDRIGLVGEKLEDHVFVAHKIRPWMPKREMRGVIKMRRLQ